MSEMGEQSATLTCLSCDDGSERTLSVSFDFPEEEEGGDEATVAAAVAAAEAIEEAEATTAATRAQPGQLSSPPGIPLTERISPSWLPVSPLPVKTLWVQVPVPPNAAESFRCRLTVHGQPTSPAYTPTAFWGPVESAPTAIQHQFYHYQQHRQQQQLLQEDQQNCCQQQQQRRQRQRSQQHQNSRYDLWETSAGYIRCGHNPTVDSNGDFYCRCS